MYTPEWKLAALCQAVIAVLGIAVAVAILKVRFRTALVAALLYNSIPIMRAPGYELKLFATDLLAPIVVLIALFGLRRASRNFITISVLAILIWPAISTAPGVLAGDAGSPSALFLYRRFILLVFLIAGLSRTLRSIRVREFLDTCVVLWIGMTLVGLLQYFNIMDTDFAKTSEFMGDESILYSSAAQTGFLGLLRPSVGIWGGVMVGYCAPLLVLEARLGTFKFVLYSVAAVLSVVVILYSGSRSGAFAMVAGLAYTGLISTAALRHVRAVRMMLFAVLGGGAMLYFLLPTLQTLSGRLEGGGFSTGSLQIRVETQWATMAYVFTHARATLLGMGPEPATFQRAINLLAQPHSEYLQILWQSGIPGLAFYLIFLLMIYRRLRPRLGRKFDALGISGRAMLIVGLVMGLAIGNVMYTSYRLVAYSRMILFVFGLLLVRPETPSPQASPRVGQRPALETRRRTVALNRSRRS